MTEREFQRWQEHRARQATQHPDEQLVMRYRNRGESWSRGDHYRRKNTGIALRTFHGVTRIVACTRPCCVPGAHS